MSSLGVYIHFPWCARKCPYCDFATEPREATAIPHAAYADAVLRELEARAPTLEGAELVSVFFGGGTPSLWDTSELGRVLTGIRGAFAQHAGEVEVTVECNPSSLSAQGVEGLARAGVNRLSVGVQSLSDDRLRFLGRLHDSRGALAALRDATRVFSRVSADLMFGMPGQTPRALEAEIDALLELGLWHISAYALTIEPATPFGEQARSGALLQAPEDDFAHMFEAAHAHFAKAGLDHYEVSNYAARGQESRHNQHYWRGGSYLGLGAAAVGCLPAGQGARRYRNHPKPERYMQRADTAEREVFEEDLDGHALVREALMLGLRTREGVDLEALAGRVGFDPLKGREAALSRRQARGDVVLVDGNLRIPVERWLMLDGIIADLF